METAASDSNMGPSKLRAAEVPAMSNRFGYKVDQIHFFWECDAFNCPKFEKYGNKPPCAWLAREFQGN